MHLKRFECTKSAPAPYGYIPLNRTDANILEHLRRVDNRQGYIKELIRRDMARFKAQ